MGDLIKIVGVQYAVNSNHVKGEDMTAQEQQKTIEFLTMLDRKHPYVSVKPEPTNETDSIGQEVSLYIFPMEYLVAILQSFLLRRICIRTD